VQRRAGLGEYEPCADGDQWNHTRSDEQQRRRLISDAVVWLISFHLRTNRSPLSCSQFCELERSQCSCVDSPAPSISARGHFSAVAFERPRCMPSLPCGVCHLVRPLIGRSTIESGTADAERERFGRPARSGRQARRTSRYATLSATAFQGAARRATRSESGSRRRTLSLTSVLQGQPPAAINSSRRHTLLEELLLRHGNCGIFPFSYRDVQLPLPIGPS
jgi:hypothetical protein